MKIKEFLPVVAFALATGAGAQSAGIKLENMNQNVKPGEDFYEFACGGWMKNNPLTPEYARYGSFDALSELNNKRVREIIETMAAPVSGEFYDSDGNLQMRTINSSGTLGTVAGSTGYVEAESAYVNDPTTGKPASYIPNRKEWNLGSGNSEFKMHHILILGKEALVRTGLSGQDSARMYTKALGSAGVLDPIDQRQSIGFKINSVGFGSTRPEAVWDYICVPTMANI